ncbi:TniB family NTP-binding protein [Pusillimonas sp. NJUB218]|uniref:TniB family NTP-binding protein n=1 Tax=Pusillimonas sp. NJUB218 TaxID=2023230 RepID=UPI000F4C8439|nr:TniB family NTP-binding protein [Pusillimonas sp. NJUB218]ROT43931.1 hypothetical protein CHR62_14995 [Pusillimonas sp. NJUB218]
MMGADKLHTLQSLKQCLEEDFYHHFYERHYTWLRELVLSKVRSGSDVREVLMFLGPARVGKTRILDALNREFGETRHSGSGRSKDLVYVRVPEGGAAGSILTAVLRAMGEPYQAATKLDELRNRVRQRFLSTGIKVAIFDEIQHTVEEGRKTAVRAASDFIKGLIEENPQVTFIFSGIPLAARLREENPQLRGRCDKPAYFLPYCWQDAHERECFASGALAVYQTVAGAMENRQVDAIRFIQACYLLGGGTFGFVLNFVRSLANALEQDSQAIYLKQEHLASAFDKNSRDTDYYVNPFATVDQISEEMLIQAWRVVMHEHGLQRYISPGLLVGGKA